MNPKIFYCLILLLIHFPSAASPDTLYIISDIQISGNRITHESVIIRELTFNTGDTISLLNIAGVMQRSRDNIMNTSLFNFVTVDYSSKDTYVTVFITVTERWYIWPVPIFEHAERNLGAFIKNPNWDRINYGLALNWANFRGRKETMYFKARLGYKEQFSIIYNKPNFGSDQNFGFTAMINKFRMHEVNITTINNKPVYLKNENQYLMEDFGSSVTLSYRNYLYFQHFISLNYSHITYRDSASHIDFLGKPFQQKSNFFTLEYILEYDIRDSKYYPLEGEYFRINLKQRGLGLIADYDENRTSVLLNGTYHKKWSDRLFHNQAIRIYLSGDRPDPAFYKAGIGYVAYMRGYELNTVDATSFGVLSNNLKYCVMHEKAFTLPVIPWPQFNKSYLSVYANLFVDAGYSRYKQPDSNFNTLRNQLLYSLGVGIDFVTYYDQVLRLETSVNKEGVVGFFIHTEVPFSRW